MAIEHFSLYSLFFREFLKLLAKYKFVIAIENAVCDDYLTEKLWRTLQLGSVPLYLGENKCLSPVFL